MSERYDDDPLDFGVLLRIGDATKSSLVLHKLISIKEPANKDRSRLRTQSSKKWE